LRRGDALRPPRHIAQSAKVNRIIRRCLNQAADILLVRLAPCDRATDRRAVRDAWLAADRRAGGAAGDPAAGHNERLDRLLADGSSALRRLCPACDVCSVRAIRLGRDDGLGGRRRTRWLVVRSISPTDAPGTGAIAVVGWSVACARVVRTRWLVRRAICITVAPRSARRVVPAWSVA
jgi:hypothetical protein